jgi:hypothetical protein
MDFWWEIHIHIGDVVMCFIIGTIFYLVFEAPSTKIIQKIFTKESKPVENGEECMEKFKV